MTKQEYEAAIQSLDMELYASWLPDEGEKIAEKRHELKEQYIASLEADNARLNRALDVAARKMYNCTGSCPNDVYGWRHPRTCGIRCKELEQPDGWVHCWREYALAEAEEEK